MDIVIIKIYSRLHSVLTSSGWTPSEELCNDVALHRTVAEDFLRPAPWKSTTVLQGSEPTQQAQHSVEMVFDRFNCCSETSYCVDSAYLRGVLTELWQMCRSIAESFSSEEPFARKRVMSLELCPARSSIPLRQSETEQLLLSQITDTTAGNPYWFQVSVSLQRHW